jgi:hypothetical protein
MPAEEVEGARVALDHGRRQLGERCSLSEGVRAQARALLARLRSPRRICPAKSPGRGPAALWRRWWLSVMTPVRPARSVCAWPVPPRSCWTPCRARRCGSSGTSRSTTCWRPASAASRGCPRAPSCTGVGSASSGRCPPSTSLRTARRRTAQQLERDATLWTHRLFFHGEERVTSTLAPFVWAAPAPDVAIFLSTQLADEARHTAGSEVGPRHGDAVELRLQHLSHAPSNLRVPREDHAEGASSGKPTIEPGAGLPAVPARPGWQRLSALAVG